MVFKPKRSLFISETLRELNHTELSFLAAAETVIHFSHVDEVTIGYASSHFSEDNKPRPIILRKKAVEKIEFKHGEINIQNLLINIHDWDIGIKNMDYIKEKINLIKRIPNSDNFLLVSAYRENGFYVLTHFETEVLEGNELKSLLGRGDSFSRDA